MAATATDKELGALHALLAQTLMKMVQGETVDELDEDGEVVRSRWVPPPANVLAVAAKFLKDNSITASPETDETLSELRRKLQARGRLAAPTEGDVREAVRSMGDYLQ